MENCEVFSDIGKHVYIDPLWEKDDDDVWFISMNRFEKTPDWKENQK